MRSAEDIVKDYRARGYSDERLRALANGRPEPICSQILELLAQGEATETEEAPPVEDVLASVPPEAADQQEEVPEAEEEVVLVVDPDEPADIEETAEDGEELEALEEADEAAPAQEEPEAQAEEEPTEAPVEIEEAVAEPEEVVAESEAPIAAAEGTAQEAEVMEAEAAGVEMVAEQSGEAGAVEPSATTAQALSDAPENAVEEVVVDLAFEEDEPAEAVEAEVADTQAATEENVEAQNTEAVADTTDANEARTLRLAEIVVERPTPEEYHANQADVPVLAGEVVDLRTETPDEPQTVIAGDSEPETADIAAQVVEVGECWPLAETVEAAAAQLDVFEKVDSGVFVVFQDDSEQTIDSIKANKAAQRSLKVLQDALREDPDLAESLEGVSNVIELHPPYAIAPEVEEVAPPVDFDQDVPVEKEESGLIRFPSEMLESYNAIVSVHAEQQAANEADEANDLEPAPAAIPAAEDDAGPAAADGRGPVIIPGESVSAPVSASAEIEEEIAHLRNWLTELEDALKLKKIEADELTRLLGERDETLALQAEELQRVRENLHADEARMHEVRQVEEKLQAAEGELASVREEMGALEREYNILATGTVPDLKQDKDDLVDLLEAEVEKQAPMKAALTESGRRVAIGYTLAAAASVLLVLSIVFQWVQENNRQMQDQVLLAELKQDLAHEQERRASLTSELKTLETNWARKVQVANAARDQAQNRLAQLKERVEEQARVIASLRVGAGSEGLVRAPRREEVARDSRALQGGRTDATFGGRRVHRNDIDMREWQARQGRSGNETRDRSEVASKKAKVREGDGVSQILWRELGQSNPGLVEWVIKKNALQRHARHGYPIIRPGQELLIPTSATAAAELRER